MALSLQCLNWYQNLTKRFLFLASWIPSLFLDPICLPNHFPTNYLELWQIPTGKISSPCWSCFLLDAAAPPGLSPLSLEGLKPRLDEICLRCPRGRLGRGYLQRDLPFFDSLHLFPISHISVPSFPPMQSGGFADPFSKPV